VHRPRWIGNEQIFRQKQNRKAAEAAFRFATARLLAIAGDFGA
jgi:hypothetical protein